MENNEQTFDCYVQGEDKPLIIPVIFDSKKIEKEINGAIYKIQQEAIDRLEKEVKFWRMSFINLEDDKNKETQALKDENNALNYGNKNNHERINKQRQLLDIQNNRIDTLLDENCKLKQDLAIACSESASHRRAFLHVYRMLIKIISQAKDAVEFCDKDNLFEKANLEVGQL